MGIIEVSGDGNDGVDDSSSKESFSDFLHFNEDHSGDFFSGVLLRLTGAISNLDVRLGVLLDELERKELLIVLDSRVSVFTTNESLHVIESSGWVVDGLVFS